MTLWDLIERGGEVAVIVPACMQLHGLAGSFGAAFTEIPLREELGWQPDPDDVARLVTNRTRAIVVTNPGNPTGVVLLEDVRAAGGRASAGAHPPDHSSPGELPDRLARLALDPAVRPRLLARTR